ncbi:MAG: hypothetical protein LUD74_00575, partial [Tannerellaceae bacterium]|nr:hypothetical protein [Tannerellaceae bacterium]
DFAYRIIIFRIGGTHVEGFSFHFYHFRIAVCCEGFAISYVADMFFSLFPGLPLLRRLQEIDSGGQWQYHMLLFL